MRERPILFSAPMVRAILAGTKTQTRRVVKGEILSHSDGSKRQVFHFGRLDQINGLLRERQASPLRRVACPFGQVGDRLWVRETWGYRCSASTTTAEQYMHTIHYRADDARLTFGPMPMDGVGLPKWRERDPGMSWEAWDARMTAYWRQWRPGMFMPRWASRITLEITGVRVERLQGISTADCWAEGISASPDVDPVHEYRDLWESINGAGSWDANPWVWVVEFKKT